MVVRSSVSTEPISTKIKVKGFEINYFQVGNGPQKLIIFPGVLGQIGDFGPLTESLDGAKYTIYICDPPGYGMSRPPNRDFSPGFLYRDADSAIALMETLGIEKYSMLGWCNGGCTAMIAASRAADRVDKLVVWSCNAYVTAKDLEYYETTRDVHDWPEGRRISQFKAYGEKYVSDTWSGWIDAFRKILDEDDGDVCRDALAKIKAPTLILHGAKDVFVPIEHGVYLHENINRSTLEIFPEGKHILQRMYPEKFVSIVDNFLSSVQ
ncbi:valacyclovir hydrolase-like [Metopolophium dirhodum]|uniref:valacyclovir hydrolase-like n=1 Tax=Metopolophium dirhodum TaxID=44670 RepID=UPI00298F6000|nr:valacyclovir hydrolase-like [Metopolophium dirhodum]XP_060870985.1 valacyclovir hydrolase-like [Metopolophium dirhodum]